MKIRGLDTMLTACRWLRSRFKGGGLILLYHRVADSGESLDPYSICVTPQNFADHMAAVREIGSPETLKGITNSNRGKKTSRRAIAVTFDDGYADNLYNAKPILQRNEIPATVFAISGNPGAAFWWDRLIDILFTPKKIPSKFYLGTKGKPLEFNTDDGSFRNRKRLLNRIYKHLQLLSEEWRNNMLDDLSKQTDPVLSTDDTRRSMTAAELRKLASDDLIEIGSHTVTHPLLTELQISEQEEEIRQSKDCLEKAIGKYVSSFSYPYGFSTGYPSDTVRLVKNAGFERACANFADLIRPGGDSFYLPRLWIRNMNKAAFVKKLLRWLA